MSLIFQALAICQNPHLPVHSLGEILMKALNFSGSCFASRASPALPFEENEAGSCLFDL